MITVPRGVPDDRMYHPSVEFRLPMKKIRPPLSNRSLEDVL
jgi:hypothetical protein